jgi:type II secretory pathway component PulF
VEAFELIHAHCERLKPSLELVRNTWLYPLICILAGWVIRLGIFLYFGLSGMAMRFVCDTFLASAVVATLVWALLKMAFVRQVVDQLLLQIPVVRETLIRLSVTLFFATFRLTYESGGLDVVAMFDLALRTVRNSAIARDLRRARPVLQENGAFEDAFGQPLLLEDSIKSSITAGALSGHLGSSLEQVVKSESMQLEITLTLFNRVFQRLVAYSVALSIVGTFLVCFAYSPSR